MTAKLIETCNVVPVTEMEDGDVGVVKTWLKHPEYEGLIAHRVGHRLNVLGEGQDLGWDNIPFGLDDPRVFGRCLVRVFQPRETIEIKI